MQTSHSVSSVFMSVQSNVGIIQWVIFSFVSRFLKIYKHSAFSGALCNLFKMFGVFGSSVTSSQSGSVL